MAANREKDEKIEQLERLIIELKEAKHQSAATVAVDYNSRSFSPPKRKIKLFPRAAGLKIILAIIVLIIASAGAWRLFGGSTFKQESVTIVEQVKELSTLATAEAHMTAIIKESDNKLFGNDVSKNLPGTKRELVFIVPGTVIAGVDLKGITSESLDINEETHEIDITLPHAKFIQEPSLQMEKRLSYENGGLFRADAKMDKGFDLAAKAQEQLNQDAKSIGLLKTAEKNAEKVLKEFFKTNGYTVNVTFK